MRISDWSSDVCSSDLVGLGDGLLSQLKTRVGYSNYTHTEFEGADVGTTFDVEGIAARLELVQNARGGWRGSSGMPYYYRDFLAVDRKGVVSGKSVSVGVEFGGRRIIKTINLHT